MDLFNRKKTEDLEFELNAAKYQLDTVKQQNEQVLKQNQELVEQTKSLLVRANTSVVNQNMPIYAPHSMEKQVHRYSTTDDIYSIIRLLSTTSALIPFYAYLVKDEKSLKRVNQKNYRPQAIVQTKLLQLKALEDLPENDRLYQLLENPHFSLSKYEFFEAIYTLLPLQGEVILYKIRNEFGANAGLTQSLEILESQWVVKHISGFPHRITSYDYAPDGIKIMENIPPEDIIHIRYFQTLSPLTALRKRLVRIDSEMDVSVAQLQNGGTPGVIFNKSGTGDPEVGTAGMHKENFYNYLQSRSNKGAPYWAGDEDLGYIQLGLKLADLEVAELAKIDFKKLCNAFAVSDVLFNNDAASTESNVNIQEKRLYTNTVLPNVYRVRDALISGLVPEFSKKDGKKRHIDCDISEISALQEDMKEMAQIYSTLPVMQPNMVLRAFKMEEDPDPAMNKFYVKTGYVSLDDLQGSGPLPLTEDYTD